MINFLENWKLCHFRAFPWLEYVKIIFIMLGARLIAREWKKKKNYYCDKTEIIDEAFWGGGGSVYVIYDMVYF